MKRNVAAMVVNRRREEGKKSTKTKTKKKPLKLNTNRPNLFRALETKDESSAKAALRFASCKRSTKSSCN